MLNYITIDIIKSWKGNDLKNVTFSYYEDFKYAYKVMGISVIKNQEKIEFGF